MAWPLRLLLEDAADDALLVVRARGRQTGDVHYYINKFTGTGIGRSNIQRVVRHDAEQRWAKAETEKNTTSYFGLNPYASAPIGKNDAVMQSYPELLP